MPGYSQNRDNLLLRDAQITASDVISIKDCFLSGNGKKSDSGVHREVGKHPEGSYRICIFNMSRFF